MVILINISTSYKPDIKRKLKQFQMKWKRIKYHVQTIHVYNISLSTIIIYSKTILIHKI